ncbi:hypothetical protein Tco_1338417 [Tanacetum coccineum]
MCLESWGRSSYASISIEIEACNDFCDNLVIAVPNLERTGYTKETIRVEYEWKHPRCSVCLIYGHSLDDCLKDPKQVVNKMDKGKGGSFEADDKGFTEVKKKKSGGDNGGNKNIKPVSVKPKPQYLPKAKQSTKGANQHMTPSIGKKNVLTSCNGTFSLYNLFEALNFENSVSGEVETGNKASTSGVKEEGQSSTPLVEKINMFKKQMLEGDYVLIDDDDHFTFRGLWRVCDEYGKVIDVFIPNRKSKAVRFQRSSAKSNTQPKVMNVGSQMGTYVWILKIRKIDSKSAQNSKPALVLDDSCILENDRKLSLMGKVKEFESIPKLYILLTKEGFFNLKFSSLVGMWMLIEFTSNDAKQNLHNHIGVGSWFTTLNHANPKFISDKRIVWVGIEGIPLHARTMNTYKKIGLKWGDVMSMEDPVDSALYQKRLCVKMEEASIIFESFKVIVQGKVYWVRAKEVNGGILQRLEALVASPIGCGGSDKRLEEMS